MPTNETARDLENLEAKANTALIAYREDEVPLMEQAIYLNGLAHDARQIAVRLVREAAAGKGADHG